MKDMLASCSCMAPSRRLVTGLSTLMGPLVDAALEPHNVMTVGHFLLLSLHLEQLSILRCCGGKSWLYRSRKWHPLLSGDWFVQLWRSFRAYLEVCHP